MTSVMTVTGPVAARDLGFTLMHEHIFLDLTRDVLGTEQPPERSRARVP